MRARRLERAVAGALHSTAQRDTRGTESGGAQMFAALRGDFSERKRERCVRLDVLPGGRLGGAEEWARLLGSALRETFEARARAYDAEARPWAPGAPGRFSAFRACGAWRGV